MNIAEAKKSVKTCTDLIGQMEDRIKPADGVTYDLFVVANHLALIVDELVNDAEQAAREIYEVAEQMRRQQGLPVRE